MSSTAVWLTLAISFGPVALIVGWVWIRDAWRGRVSVHCFRRVALRRIDEVHDGDLVRLVGKIVAGDRVLRAPSDGAPCVYYEAIFQKARYRRGDAWVDVHHRASRAFWLAVGDDRVRVSGKELDVHLALAQCRRGELGTLPPGVRRVFERAGGDAKKTSFDLDYTEHRVSTGHTVAVVGRARWRTSRELARPSPDAADYRGSAGAARRELALEASSTDGPVLVSPHAATHEP